MLFRKLRYSFFITGSLFFGIYSSAQSISPAVNVSFGHAATSDPSVVGPPLSTGYSEYSYTSNVCPPPGSYTIISSITGSCFKNEWINLSHDNTPFPDKNGYMMVINDTSYLNPRIVFLDSVKGVCNDVNYEFSAAIINLEKPTNDCVKFSSLTLQVEDELGNIIASTTTGDIEFAAYNAGYYFTKYFVDFSVPAGVSGIVLKIFDIPKSQAITCQNALAIDDIRLDVMGSMINIGFDPMLTNDSVKNLCFRNNSSLTMYGTIESPISNPAVQWQQSSDDGTSWTDIAGAEGYTLTQNFSRPDTVLFRLRGSDSLDMYSPSCNFFSNLLEVRVNGDPTGVTVVNNSPLCAGNDLNLSATGGDLFGWIGPNGFIDSVSSPNIYLPALNDSGMYYVRIATLGGCSIVDSTRVIMMGTEVHASPDTSICTGNSVQLNVTPGITYEWSPGESLSNSSIKDPVARPAVTTVYTVNVTDSIGCINRANVTIKVLNQTAVRAGIAGSEFLCGPNDSASFKDASTGDIIQWNWNFGNGQIDSGKNPPAQKFSLPNAQATLLVRLTVTDSAGCSDSTSIVVRVESNCSLLVPTAFTPNGDGRNDYLYPLNAYKATNLLFRVYDRRGQLIFETKDAARKWDGKLRGVLQPEGVYVWMLEYNDERGKKIFLKGTTLLLR